MIVGIFIVVYSSIDPINTSCLFSPIICSDFNTNPTNPGSLTYTGDGDDDEVPGLDDADEGEDG